MSTTMHRLQISLPRSQMEYLTMRARREGSSVAEVIRRMVQNATDTAPRRSVDSLWDIVGIGREQKPLIGDIPVSEQPALYLSDLVAPRDKFAVRKQRRHGLRRRR